MNSDDNGKGKGKSDSYNEIGESSRDNRPADPTRSSYKGKGKAHTSYNPNVSNSNPNVSNNMNPDLTNLNHLQSIKTKIFGSFKRNIYWVLVERFKTEHLTYSEFKNVWSDDTKILKEIKRNIKNDIDLGKHKIKVAKGTFNWFLNRRKG